MFVTRKSLEKLKFSKPEFVRDTSEFDMYLIEIVNTYAGCFVLKFFDIVYYLYWCRTYETFSRKSCRKLGVVLFLLFSYSHRRTLFLQSMKIKIIAGLILT